MKKFLKIVLAGLLLAAGIGANAQPTTHGLLSSALQNGISFSNNKPVHQVYHDEGTGAGVGGLINLPYGYKLSSWHITPHQDSATVLYSGTTRGISVNIAWAGIDHAKGNQYDLWVYPIAPSGHAAKAKVFPGEFIITHKTVTALNADVVIHLSSGGIGAYNGAWHDYTGVGHTFYIDGTYTGATALNFFYWLSTDPMHPVIFAFDDAVLNVPTAQAFRFGENQGVSIDGVLHDDIKHEFGLTSNNCVGENFYFTIADGTHTSKWWSIMGLRAQNGAFTNGGGAFVVQSVGTATFNDSNYQFDQLIVTKVSLQNANSEGFYIFHTTDNDVPAWSKGKNLYFVRCFSDGARNENFQIGGTLTGEVYKCRFTNGGIGQESGQMNNVVFKYGNVALQYYMNYSVSVNDAFQSFPGITGTSTYVYNSIFNNVGGTNVNYLFSIQQLTSNGDVTTVTVGNTMLFNTLPGYEFYNDATNPPSGSPKTKSLFYSGWNVVCSNTTTPSQINNSYDATTTTLADLNYANYTSPLFTSLTNHDYRPSSTSSPMLGITRNSTVATAAAAGCYYMNYDYNGDARMAWKQSAGAFSGTNLY